MARAVTDDPHGLARRRLVAHRVGVCGRGGGAVRPRSSPAGDAAQEGGQLEGLADGGDGAHLVRPCAQISVGGDGDAGNRGGSGVGAQTAADGGAIQTGHVGVEQDEVGADGAGERQHEVAGGGMDLIALQGEEVTQERHDLLIGGVRPNPRNFCP